MVWPQRIEMDPSPQCEMFWPLDDDGDCSHAPLTIQQNDAFLFAHEMHMYLPYQDVIYIIKHNILWLSLLLNRIT